VTPSAKRQAIALLVTEHRLSVVHACRVVRLARAAWYQPPRDRLVRDAAVIDALTTLVERNGRWGFWKLYGRLRHTGHEWNHKRVHRIYCALRLNRARRTRRRVPRRQRIPLSAPPLLNQTWALDFMSDTLYDGRVFRTLNVLDQGNREALAIEIGFSLPSRRVLALLEELLALHGAPRALRMDNGPEFLAGVVATWADARGIDLDFIQSGKPAQNASSNASTRPIAPKCSTQTCSIRSQKLERSPRTGWCVTTRSGPMTASAGCRHSLSCRGQPAPPSPSLPVRAIGELTIPIQSRGGENEVSIGKRSRQPREVRR